MTKGEESLKLELARRHAVTPDEQASIASPPDPSDTLILLLLGAGLLLMVIIKVFVDFCRKLPLQR